MTRKPPVVPPGLTVEFQPPPNVTSLTLTYKLITPLFGGGAEPKKADPISTIRVPEIRGLLRFWWRATLVDHCSSLKEISEHEANLWGSSSQPSNVKVQLLEVHYDEVGSLPAYTVENRKPRSSDQIVPYATFPLQPEQDELRDPSWKSEKVLKDVTFTLKIQFPKGRATEMENALWAWETFGGIGARTRRGFGALRLVKRDGEIVALPDVKSYYRGIQEKLATLKSEREFCRGIPHIGPNSICKLTTFDKSTKRAWSDLIGKYKDFRQSRNISYVAERRHFGISHWPEPKLIRSRFPKPGGGNWAHPVVGPVIAKAPRAKFGLPVLFQFPQAGEPPTTTLQGRLGDDFHAKIDRMASPLILRPVSCSQNGEEGAVGLALILDWTPVEPGQEVYTPPGGLFLTNNQGSSTVTSDLDPSETAAILPMVNSKGMTNPLVRFMDSL